MARACASAPWSASDPTAVSPPAPTPPTHPESPAGGCKNYLGNHKQCDNNVILYPGIAGRSAGGRKCQTDDNGEFAEQFHEGNTCATADGDFYSFSNCNAGNLATTVYVTANNTLLSDTGNFAPPCGVSSFSAWQQLNQDAGSSVQTTPDIATLIALGAAKVL